ncbi:hypothetical protein ACFPOE_12835 [Caenimonas terrae]|uniref:DUF4148 domain-containing protein n=1 Tax=Caenimonas terrae TaxID=696074 RepID=A0ABW0NEU2_9BURK
MKFHTLALAAALAFGGVAFAASNDTATAPSTPVASTSVKVKHHASRHAVRRVTKKHHRAMTTAKRHHGREYMASSTNSDLSNDTSREARMDEALRKFRTSHS